MSLRLISRSSPLRQPVKTAATQWEYQGVTLFSGLFEQAADFFEGKNFGDFFFPLALKLHTANG